MEKTDQIKVDRSAFAETLREWADMIDSGELAPSEERLAATIFVPPNVLYAHIYIGPAGSGGGPAEKLKSS